METTSFTTCDTPNLFVAHHQRDVIGELHGFDRLRLQGTLPPLYRTEILQTHLGKEHVLYKDFRAYTEGFTRRMEAQIEGAALQRQRQVVYLPSSRLSKEERARQIAAEEGITSGVICVFRCPELGRTYQACPNRATRKLELRLRPRRSNHLYVYLLHQVLGFMHLRFQTWFPFLVQICCNGREWLAQQMTRAGLGFRRERNSFSYLEDVGAAQALMNAQLETDWPALCNGLVEEFNPVAAEVRAPLGLQYYWTTPETEYATDVMFRSRQALEGCYPRLVHHGITSFGAGKVLRFLGQRLNGFEGELKSVRTPRVEGVCLKHWVKSNSIKMYDKGSVLRVETTINQAHDLRVLRQPEGHPEAQPEWRPMRRSTADLHRRAQLSRGATLRYFEALSAVAGGRALCDQATRLCRRVRYHGSWQRALNPFAEEDARLLAAINDLKFTVTGLTNAQLRQALGEESPNATLRRRQASRTTRRLRLLRAHGLLRKVAKTHRYHVTAPGRALITALLAARQANLEKLTKLAA